MNVRLAFFGVATVLASSAAFGCGDSAGAGGAGGTGSTASSPTSASSTSSSTSKSTGTGTASSSSGGVVATCEGYCTTLLANCTGNNSQFTGMDQCVASCAAYPTGTIADTSGNTLGCRAYHAGAAAGSATAATTHCAHAGPGGDGTCGTVCDGFCQIAQKYCTGANQVYTSLPDCKATCALAKVDLRFSVTPEPTGAQQACLLYHAQEGSVVPADHCLGDLKKDPGGPSITCQ